MARKTLQQLADEVGISVRTMERYSRMGCPKTSANAVVKWRDKNIQKKPEPIRDEETDDEISRAQLLRYQIGVERQKEEKLKIENAKLRGELIERESVEKEIAAFCVRARSRLMGLSAEIASLVPGEIKATTKLKVEQAVRLALKEIADSEYA